MRKTLFLSLWLPIGVVILSVLRFGRIPGLSLDVVPMLFSLPAMVFGLALAWPGGIPLTRALERLEHALPAGDLTRGCGGARWRVRWAPPPSAAARPIGIWSLRPGTSRPGIGGLWLLREGAPRAGEAAG